MARVYYKVKSGVEKSRVVSSDVGLHCKYEDAPLGGEELEHKGIMKLEEGSTKCHH